MPDELPPRLTRPKTAIIPSMKAAYVHSTDLKLGLFGAIALSARLCGACPEPSVRARAGPRYPLWRAQPCDLLGYPLPASQTAIPFYLFSKYHTPRPHGVKQKTPSSVHRSAARPCRGIAGVRCFMGVIPTRGLLKAGRSGGIAPPTEGAPGPQPDSPTAPRAARFDKGHENTGPLRS